MSIGTSKPMNMRQHIIVGRYPDDKLSNGNSLIHIILRRCSDYM